MSTNYNSSIVTNGLVLYCDTGNTQKSWKGKPTTNIVPDMSLIGMGQGITITYVGLENGWKKYSISGTWTGGGYPYSMYVDGVTFAAGTYYSTSCYIKTNVPSKFANVFTGMNYVNQPMNDSGTSFSVTQSDGSIFVGRSGFAYTSATSQVGYLVSNPNVSQVFTAATDFVYIKSGQIELGTFPTPFVAGTRSTTQAILDVTGSNTITTTSLTYTSDGTFSFNGSNNYLTISTFTNKPTTAITVEAWIRPTKPTLSGTIRGGVISATNSMYLGIIDSVDGGVTHALHWANQTSVSRIQSWNGNIPNNAWSHIAGTYDGTTMRAYINGVQVYSAAQTGTIPDASYVLGTYGGALADGVHNFNGLIPASKIYNRALTADEMKQNFNALRGRYGI